MSVFACRSSQSWQIGHMMRRTPATGSHLLAFLAPRWTHLRRRDTRLISTSTPGHQSSDRVDGNGNDSNPRAAPEAPAEVKSKNAKRPGLQDNPFWEFEDAVQSTVAKAKKDKTKIDAFQKALNPEGEAFEQVDDGFKRGPHHRTHDWFWSLKDALAASPKEMEERTTKWEATDILQAGERPRAAESLQGAENLQGAKDPQGTVQGSDSIGVKSLEEELRLSSNLHYPRPIRDVYEYEQKPAPRISRPEAPAYFASPLVLDLIDERCPGVRNFEEADEAEQKRKYAQPTPEGSASRERLTAAFAEVKEGQNAARELKSRAWMQETQQWGIEDIDIVSVALRGAQAPTTRVVIPENEPDLAARLTRNGIPRICWDDDKTLIRWMTAKQHQTRSCWSRLEPQVDNLARELSHVMEGGKVAQKARPRLLVVLTELADFITGVKPIHAIATVLPQPIPSGMRQHLLRLLTGAASSSVETGQYSLREAMATYPSIDAAMTYALYIRVLSGIGAWRTIWHEWRRSEELSAVRTSKQSIFAKSLVQAHSSVLHCAVRENSEHSYTRSLDLDLEDMMDEDVPQPMMESRAQPIPTAIPVTGQLQKLICDALGVKSAKQSLKAVQRALREAAEAQKTAEGENGAT